MDRLQHFFPAAERQVEKVLALLCVCAVSAAKSATMAQQRLGDQGFIKDAALVE